MGTLATGAGPVTRDEFDRIFEQCKNWGRWGQDDERGTLNFVTPDTVRSAAGLVKSGRTVNCSWPLDTKSGPDNPKPVVHHMTFLHDVPVDDSGDLRFTMDYVAMEPHGDAHSHLDALCHVLFGGRLYNGVAADDAITSQGARVQGVDVARDGIVGRGILIDIPRLRRVPWVEPGQAITAEEIEAAEQQQGVRMQEGDIIMFRTGHARKRLDEGPWDAANAKAGLHTTAMPLLHERGIAGIGYDGDGETVPSNCEGVRYPIHAISVVAMGMWTMDSLQFEDLAAACAEEGRNEFLCVIAPLRLAGGTGCPVNPIAIF